MIDVEKKGTHILSSLNKCKNENLLKSSFKLLELITESIRYAGLTAVGQGSHSFENSGVTAFVLLQESHVSIHTWPEKENFVHLDVFVCNLENDNTQRAHRLHELIVNALCPEVIENKVVDR